MICVIAYVTHQREVIHFSCLALPRTYTLVFVWRIMDERIEKHVSLTMLLLWAEHRSLMLREKAKVNEMH